MSKAIISYRSSEIGSIPRVESVLDRAKSVNNADSLGSEAVAPLPEIAVGDLRGGFPGLEI